jgi:hypothetical protein
VSYWIIKGPEDSSNYLCDYRPDIACPQWSGSLARAYKFTSRQAATDFYAEMRKSYSLGEPRFVHVSTRLDRKAKLATLRAENERLRMVIKIGGAMYRAERACMEIPGGIDPAPPQDKSEGTG